MRYGQHMEKARVSVTAVLALPPKTPSNLPKWVGSWLRETQADARKELGMKPLGDWEVAWREPLPSEDLTGDFWAELGYEELALSVEFG